jgi:peroxiredoxin
MGKLAILLSAFLVGCGAAQPVASTPVAAGERDVVMVVFFTTWCPASAEAVRAASAMRADYARAGLVSFAVDVGDTPADVARFMARNAIEMPVQRDEGGRLAERLGLPTVPAIVIMDRGGAVRHVQSGYHGEGDATSVRRVLDGMLASTTTPAHASSTSAFE